MLASLLLLRKVGAFLFVFVAEVTYLFTVVPLGDREVGTISATSSEEKFILGEVQIGRKRTAWVLR